MTSSSIGESGKAIHVLQKHGVTDLQELLSDRHSSKESNPKSHLHIVIVPNATDSVTTSIFKSHISVVKEDIACRSLGIMHPIDSMFLFKPNRICLLEDSLIFIHLKYKTK